MASNKDIEHETLLQWMLSTNWDLEYETTCMEGKCPIGPYYNLSVEEVTGPRCNLQDCNFFQEGVAIVNKGYEVPLVDIALHLKKQTLTGVVTSPNNSDREMSEGGEDDSDEDTVFDVSPSGHEDTEAVSNELILERLKHYSSTSSNTGNAEFKRPDPRLEAREERLRAQDAAKRKQRTEKEEATSPLMERILQERKELEKKNEELQQKALEAEKLLLEEKLRKTALEEKMLLKETEADIAKREARELKKKAREERLLEKEAEKAANIKKEAEKQAAIKRNELERKELKRREQEAKAEIDKIKAKEVEELRVKEAKLQEETNALNKKISNLTVKNAELQSQSAIKEAEKLKEARDKEAIRGQHFKEVTEAELKAQEVYAKKLAERSKELKDALNEAKTIADESKEKAKSVNDNKAGELKVLEAINSNNIKELNEKLRAGNEREEAYKRSYSKLQSLMEEQRKLLEQKTLSVKEMKQEINSLKERENRKKAEITVSSLTSRKRKRETENDSDYGADLGLASLQLAKRAKKDPKAGLERALSFEKRRLALKNELAMRKATQIRRLSTQAVKAKKLGDQVLVDQLRRQQLIMADSMAMDGSSESEDEEFFEFERSLKESTLSGLSSIIDQLDETKEISGREKRRNNRGDLKERLTVSSLINILQTLYQKSTEIHATDVVKYPQRDSQFLKMLIDHPDLLKCKVEEDSATLQVGIDICRKRLAYGDFNPDNAIKILSILTTTASQQTSSRTVGALVQMISWLLGGILTIEGKNNSTSLQDALDKIISFCYYFNCLQSIDKSRLMSEIIDMPIFSEQCELFKEIEMYVGVPADLSVVLWGNRRTNSQLKNPPLSNTKALDQLGQSIMSIARLTFLSAAESQALDKFKMPEFNDRLSVKQLARKLADLYDPMI